MNETPAKISQATECGISGDEKMPMARGEFNRFLRVVAARKLQQQTKRLTDIEQKLAVIENALFNEDTGIVTIKNDLKRWGLRLGTAIVVTFLLSTAMQPATGKILQLLVKLLIG